MKRAYYELRRVVFVMGAVILSPFIYFFISYRKPRASDDKPIRILIIPHLTRIGDLMCATPVFRAIKEEYPDAQVAVLVAGRLEGLLRNNRSVDEIIIYRHFDLWGTIKKIRSGNFDWSFSGLKTAVARELTNKKIDKSSAPRLAAEIQEAITDVLVEKTLNASKLYKPKSLLIAGGVAANIRLREKFEHEIRKRKMKMLFHVPPVALCTDNASYIASCAFFNFSPVSWKTISANPQLTIAGES